MERGCGLGTATRWGRVPAWWLLHGEIDADGFCVLAAMATYADDEGLCDPSQATLARWLKRSRPWVNRVISQLADRGFIEKTGRSRRNGGTTSCLYRLRLAPPDVPVTAVTGAVSTTDTPCHRGDTNQPKAEQSPDCTPRAPEAASASKPSPEDAVSEVPADWEPSDTEISQALQLCPDADLLAHTVRFRSRCRAKGYRFRQSAIGDAWLVWLIEDHGRTPPRRGDNDGTATSAPNRRRSPSPAERADERFAAWSAAATLPLSTWR